jgi:hypothetical protein
MNFAGDLDFYTRMIPLAKQPALASRMRYCIRPAHSDRGGLWRMRLAQAIEIRDTADGFSTIPDLHRRRSLTLVA